MIQAYIICIYRFIQIALGGRTLPSLRDFLGLVIKVQGLTPSATDDRHSVAAPTRFGSRLEDQTSLTFDRRCFVAEQTPFWFLFHSIKAFATNKRQAVALIVNFWKTCHRVPEALPLVAHGVNRGFRAYKYHEAPEGLPKVAQRTRQRSAHLAGQKAPEAPPLVAHGANRGFRAYKYHEAPEGLPKVAQRTRQSSTHLAGQKAPEGLPKVAHGGSHGVECHKIPAAPEGRQKNTHAKSCQKYCFALVLAFLSSLWDFFVPTFRIRGLTPTATNGRHSVASWLFNWAHLGNRGGWTNADAGRPSMALSTLAFATVLATFGCQTNETSNNLPPDSRPKEITFWHFWGGEDRAVVEHVAEQFNRSQTKYRVRPIAMPGNNLNAKLFLSVAGGDPPDLVNQDDPVLADWADRGLIQPLDKLMTQAELNRIRQWLFPASDALSTHNEQFFAICNGLDIRALYVNRTALSQAGFLRPGSIKQLDAIANHFADANAQDPRRPIGFLPDSRRLFAWASVFGGSFHDSKTGQLTIDSPANVAALEWMSNHYERVGVDRAVAFRSSDQSLPGKTFPLLPVKDDEMVGRYVAMMDGQWRVRDINRFVEKRKSENLPAPEFNVCPLPLPTDPSLRPRLDAGWVNGNCFMVPSGANHPVGAWEFIKFWVGFDDPKTGAETCIAGGWIPVSNEVVQTESFQKYLKRQPLFGQFVHLAASQNQFPTPQIPGALNLQRTVNTAAYDAMTHPEKDAAKLLQAAQAQIEQSLARERGDR